MGLKKSFSKDKTKCTVTFTVSPEAAQGAKQVNIAGDFNSWSSTTTPLTMGNPRRGSPECRRASSGRPMRSSRSAARWL